MGACRSSPRRARGFTRLGAAMTEGTYAIDTSTPAVVLKFDPNVMHHGGLGVIRSLGRIGVPVYGVHEGLWAPAASSRYLAGRFFWQPSPEDTDRVLAGLRRLAEHIGRPSVLLTTDDAGAIFLAEHGRDLRDRFLFPDPPEDLPRRLAGKYSLHELCRELGVPSPRTIRPASLAAAREFASATGYPLIAKLTTPWAEGSALRSTTVLASREDLDHAYHSLRTLRRRADAAAIHPGRAGPRLVLPRVLRRRIDLPAGLHRRQGTVLSGHGRADQPGTFRGERRIARAGHQRGGQTGLPGNSRPRYPPGRAHRRVPPARFQSPARGAVPALPRHRGHRRRAGRLPRPDRSADTAGRAGERARLPGRELRPDQRAVPPAPPRPDPAGLAGLAAHGRRDRVVRARRPEAVRPHVPADGLAPGQPPVAGQRATSRPAPPPLPGRPGGGGAAAARSAAPGNAGPGNAGPGTPLSQKEEMPL